MKKLLYNISKSAICIALTSAMGSCQDEYVAVDLLSDVAWFTSEIASHPDPAVYELNQGTVVAFMDSSQGCKSHKWVIEEGAQFMINDFDFKSDYDSQIDPDKGFESSESVENVIFNTPGTTTVTMYNTFYEWVISHDEDPQTAVLGDNEWIFEKVFEVTVFPTIEPAFRVEIDGQPILDFEEGEFIPSNSELWRTVDLGIGEKLTFVNTTSDYALPDGVVWSVPNSSESSSSASTANFTFNEMGEFSGFTMKVTRSSPSDNTTVKIPLIVNVIPSTDPFVMTSLETNSSKTNSIIVNANGSYGALSELEAENFSIVAAVDGDEADISHLFQIESVTISEESSAELLINLSDNIYPGEILTIAYDGDGDIVSIDDREFGDFAATRVTNNLVGESVLDSSVNSFGTSAATIQNAGWYTLPDYNTAGYVGISDSPDANDSGNYCMKVDATTAITSASLYFNHYTGTVQASAGSYTMSYKMWIPESCTALDDESLCFTLSYKNDTDAWADFSPTTNYPTVAQGRGKWVTMEYPVTFATDFVNGRFKFTFLAANLPEGAIFYFDDLELCSARPASN
ncbi:MAG: hypothetical protein R3Y68_03325 [Rikenellaceae bacterium]